MAARTLLPLSACLLVGCSDQKLSTHWDDPSISIVEPLEGASVAEGAPLNFSTQFVVDARHSSSELIVVWSSDVDGPLTGTDLIEDGTASLSNVMLSSGEHVVTVELTDPRNETATDQVGLFVVPNTAPTANIYAPEDGAYFEEGASVSLEAFFEDDTEADLSSLKLSWTLDDIPWGGAAASPDEIGLISAVIDTPSLGEHTIAVTVEDSVAATGSDTVTFYVVELDADGDGFVNAQLGGDDCDDSNDAIHPKATEICDDDNVDEDCDGLIDDEDPSVEGQVEAWPDKDGDSWGAEGKNTLTCEVVGTATRGSDCDDDNEYVNPDATEVCDDGLDNDCDNDVTECWLAGDFTTDVADSTIWGANASDNYAASLSGGDFDGDGYTDILAGATGESTNGGSAGAAYLITGPISSGAALVTDYAHTVWYGLNGGDLLGTAVSVPGDINDDGAVDLLIGAPEVEVDARNTGTVYLAAGPISAGTGSLMALVEGEEGGGNLGAALGMGDINCDGTPDFVVGEPGSSASSSGAGAAHVWLGPVTTTSTIADADMTIFGDDSGDNLGTALAIVGDVSGDGCDDFTIGSPNYNANYSNDGAVYFFLGSSGLSGTVNAASADVLVVGAESGDNLGNALGFIGDIDDSAYNDLAVAAPEHNSNAGGMWIFTSPMVSSYPATLDIGKADIEYTGDQNGDRVGTSFHGGHDIEGDGCVDLLVGAVQHENDSGNDNRGAGFLLSCPSTGGSGNIDSLYTARFGGMAAYNQVGAAVQFFDDITGNGKPDAGIGAPQSEGADTNAGGLFIYQGRGE